MRSQSPQQRNRIHKEKFRGRKVGGPKRRVWLRAFLILSGFLGVQVHATVHAYMMPADQVIGLMAHSFRKFKNQSLTQRVFLVNVWDRDLEFSMKQRLLLQSPDLFREERGGTFSPFVPGDKVFYRFLMAGEPRNLMSLLRRLGVNLETVSFTRFDRQVAYRIGDSAGDGLKLIVEKKRFLPLELTYRLPDRPEADPVTVRFKDYRRLDQGWYPYEVVYFGRDGLAEVLRVELLEAGTSIQGSLSEIPLGPTGGGDERGEGHGGEKEGGLKDLIKALEEKYR